MTQLAFSAEPPMHSTAGADEPILSQLRLQLKAELDARSVAGTLPGDNAMFGRGDGLPEANSRRRITPRMRATLCGWLVEVCQEFQLHQETLYLGISLLDRFLWLQPGVHKHQLQLVGTACLFIAAKQEEVTFPGLSSFVDIANNSFTREELFHTEVYILQALDYRIAMPTVHRFLGMLLEGLQLNDIGSALSSYLMELSVIETCTVTQPPSTTALAAAIIAGTLTESQAAMSFLANLDPSMIKVVNVQMAYLRRLYEHAYDEDDQLHYTHVMKEKYDKAVWQCVPMSVPQTTLKSQFSDAVDACAGSPASTHSSAASEVDMLCIEA